MDADGDGGGDPAPDVETSKTPITPGDNPVDNNANGEEENDEDSYDSEEDDSSDNDGEDEGKKWLDVRDLRNLSLGEVKKLLADDNSNANESVPSRKVDQPITKVIVRRLPPEITIATYLENLPEIPSYNYIRLVPHHKDYPSRIGKRNSIYINFDKEEEAFWFKEKYNNMTLFDEYGNDYISCVDFSLVQDLLCDPEEDDPQMGTLEDSEVYKKFLDDFEEDQFAFTMVRPDNIPTPEAMLDEILHKNFEEHENTPLLQFLRRRTEKEENDRASRDQRRRERDIARRRQKEDSAKRKQKEKDEARKNFRERDEAAKRDKDKHKERRRERDRERQRERDRERRLRRERERAAAADNQSAGQGNNSGAGEQTGPDKDKASSGQGGKNRGAENEKDAKTKSGFGTVTYSKSGNVTRWSENSGPRKNDKRNKDDNQKEGDQKPSSSLELLVEPKRQPPGSKNEDTVVTKSPFGKPFPNFPSKDNKGSTTSKSADDKSKSVAFPTHNETVEKPKESSSTVASSEGGSTTKKKVVKKVIRVKKVSREKDDNDQDNSESKPKKIVRVIRKSSKSEESNPSKSSNVSPKGEDTSQGNKASSSTSTQDSKGGESEKERKNRKGRPEIQIYRPGSLRGGATTSKPSASKAGGDKDRDKERSSDNP